MFFLSKMPLIARLVISIFAACVLCACALTVGSRADPEAFKKLVVGQTTEEEAIALLGRPSFSHKNPDGTSLIGYTETRIIPTSVTATGNALYPLMSTSRTESFRTFISFDAKGKYLSTEGAP